MNAEVGVSGDASNDVIGAEVPRRLREQRKARGISVRELARRLGVSPSAISQIETGRARPSVATLYAIVSELELSLDELFDHTGARDARPERPASPTPGVVRAGEREVLDFNVGVHWERLTATRDPNVEFLAVTYEPGACSSPDQTLMNHRGQEYGLVTSGELELTVAFETTILRTGDSISFASTTPHRLRNLGPVPATAVWVVLGRGSDPRMREPGVED